MEDVNSESDEDTEAKAIKKAEQDNESEGEEEEGQGSEDNEEDEDYMEVNKPKGRKRVHSSSDEREWKPQRKPSHQSKKKVCAQSIRPWRCDD